MPNVTVAKETRNSCSTITDQIFKNRKGNTKNLYKRKDECRKLEFSTTRKTERKRKSKNYSGRSESKNSCASLSSQIYKAKNTKTKKALHKRKDKCRKLGFSTTSKGWG